MNHEQIKQIIVNELDIEGLPSDVVGAVLVRLTEQSIKQCMLDVYDALSADDQKELKRQMGAVTPPAHLNAWLKEKLPNFREIAEQATRKMIQEYQQARLELFSS